MIEADSYNTSPVLHPRPFSYLIQTHTRLSNFTTYPFCHLRLFLLTYSPSLLFPHPSFLSRTHLFCSATHPSVFLRPWYLNFSPPYSCRPFFFPHALTLNKTPWRLVSSSLSSEGTAGLVTPLQRLSTLIADWEFEVGALRHAKGHGVPVMKMRTFIAGLTTIDP